MRWRSLGAAYAFVGFCSWWGSAAIAEPLDLRPVDEWTEQHARHLASRAGFGATPAEVRELTALDATAAVARFIEGKSS